jgi:integrase
VKAPKLDERVIEPLTDDQLRALLKTCTPPTGAEPKVALWHRRDEALIRLMFETGLRAGEAVDLQFEDIDLLAGTAVVRRGKGRVVPFGADTALALDRYLRLRRGHRLADSPALWLGDRASGSPTTRCTRRSASALMPRVSMASIPTDCGTQPRTDGSPQAARSPG